MVHRFFKAGILFIMLVLSAVVVTANPQVSFKEPVNDMEIYKGATFNITLNVSCQNEPCGLTNVSLFLLDFGDGSDGELIVDSGTVTLDTNANPNGFNFTRVYVAEGATLTATGSEPLIIRANTSVNISGHLDLDGGDGGKNGHHGGSPGIAKAGGWNGGNGAVDYGDNGDGPGRGSGGRFCDRSNGDVGGGGGGGSYGTRGTKGHGWVCGWFTSAGNTYGDPMLTVLQGGSGGGSGSGDNDNGQFEDGAGGGAGGGAVKIMSRNINVNGSITADGGDGGSAYNYNAGESGSGGGGSGGAIWLSGFKINISGSISAEGGRGPHSGEEAGDGGDGRIRIDYMSLNGTTSPTPRNVSIKHYVVNSNKSKGPFHTINSLNAHNIEVNKGDSYEATFSLNVTGLINSTHRFLVSAYLVNDLVSISQPKYGSVKIKQLLPISSKFENFERTTNFSSMPDLSAVENLTLGSPHGTISFGNNTVNAQGQNYNKNVIFGDCFVAVNTSALDQTFNATAYLLMNNSDGHCGDNTIFVTSQIVADAGAIRNGTKVCKECRRVNFNGEILTFRVPHFSSYAIGSNSNITVDADDPQLVNKTVTFTAVYRNSSSGDFISGANCEIDLPTGTQSMTEATQQYIYQTSFTQNNTYQYNVTCSKTGYNTLLVQDSFEILPTGGAVPEFSAIGVLLLISITIIGIFLWRKRK